MPDVDDVDPEVVIAGDDAVIDFEKAEEPPSGELLLKPTKAVAGVSQNNNRKVTLHLKVVDAEDPSMVGRMLFNDLTFTQAAAFRVTQAAKGFGILGLLPKPMTVNAENVQKVAEAFMSPEVEPIWCLVTVQPGSKNAETGEEYGPRANVKRWNIKHDSD